MVNFKTILFIALALEVTFVVEGFAYSTSSSTIKSGLFKLKSRAAKDRILRSDRNRSLQRSVKNGRQLRDDLLLDVAKSFKNITGFIAREAEKGNDDLLFSVRITQGQLTQLHAESPHLLSRSAISLLLQSAEEDLAKADEVLFRNFQNKKKLNEGWWCRNKKLNEGRWCRNKKLNEGWWCRNKKLNEGWWCRNKKLNEGWWCRNKKLNEGRWCRNKKPNEASGECIDPSSPCSCARAAGCVEISYGMNRRHTGTLCLRNADFAFMMAEELWEGLQRQEADFSYPSLGSVWKETHGHDYQGEHKFDEDASDACLSELRLKENLPQDIATTERNSSCPVSDSCWKLMTKPNTQGYELTHNLLFLSIGWSAGCAPDLEARARTDFAERLQLSTAAVTPDMMRDQCRRVLEEARVTAAAGYPDNDKDLFLEQGMLCGATIRMPEFFEPAFVRSAISWQKPSGCYGFHDVDDMLNSLSPAQKAAFAMDLRLDDFPNDVTDKNGDLINYLEGRRESLYDHLEEDRSQQAMGLFPGRSSRKSLTSTARREKIMNRSCFSHNSAVALGYLAVAMRYLADE
ncbi:Protein of unknown function DUF4735 [Trinorchestia longiramus]|nr:Protein of unknown function DUF4735 [Trinorchestia longiramus]